MRQDAVLARHQTVWREYLELCKPRVVTLIVFTAIVGMFLATPELVPLKTCVLGTLGIGLGAASGAALNHLAEQKSDALMSRTRFRPLPMGRIDPATALLFALGLCLGSVLILGLFVNPLTALLTLLSMVGYSVLYTLLLKRRTPQNIVIGGAAGAMPPVLGWTAVTGYPDAHSLLLFSDHLRLDAPALLGAGDRQKGRVRACRHPDAAGHPRGRFTRLQILLYTVILFVVSLLPFITRMSGVLYLVGRGRVWRGVLVLQRLAVSGARPQHAHAHL